MKTDQQVHLGGRISRPVDQILFLRSEINYTHIFMRNGDHFVVATTLKKLESRLCSFGFWRINKSELINLAAAKILKNEGVVKFRNHKPMKISRRKKLNLEFVLSEQD